MLFQGNGCTGLRFFGQAYEPDAAGMFDIPDDEAHQAEARSHGLTPLGGPAPAEALPHDIISRHAAERSDLEGQIEARDATIAEQTELIDKQKAELADLKNHNAVMRQQLDAMSSDNAGDGEATAGAGGIGANAGEGAAADAGEGEAAAGGRRVPRHR